MHYQANYEEVLTQMMGQITESMSAREERKNILFSMKLTLIAISVMSVIIVALIGKGIGVDVKGILTKNLAGQCILFITNYCFFWWQLCFLPRSSHYFLERVEELPLLL